MNKFDGDRNSDLDHPQTITHQDISLMMYSLISLLKLLEVIDEQSEIMSLKLKIKNLPCALIHIKNKLHCVETKVVKRDSAI